MVTPHMVSPHMVTPHMATPCIKPLSYTQAVVGGQPLAVIGVAQVRAVSGCG